ASVTEMGEPNRASKARESRSNAACASAQHPAGGGRELAHGRGGDPAVAVSAPSPGPGGRRVTAAGRLLGGFAHGPRLIMGAATAIGVLALALVAIAPNLFVFFLA